MYLGKPDATLPPLLPAPTEEQSRVEAKVDDAVKAVTALIGEILGTSSPSKFVQVAQLCDVGQALQRTKGQTIKDFMGDEDPNFVGQDAVGVLRPRIRYPGAGIVMGNNVGALNGVAGWNGDINALNREAIMMIGPVMQTLAETQRSTLTRNEANELESLRSLIDGMGPLDDGSDPDAEERAVLEARFSKLVANMRIRNEVTAEPAPPDKRSNDGEDRERRTGDSRIDNGIGVRVEAVCAIPPDGHIAGYDAEPHLVPADVPR